jgi:FIST N domain
MRAQYIVWNGQSGWQTKGEVGDPSLVLYFGTREALACGRRYEELRVMYPGAHVLGCSTGGQINNNDVGDDEIVAAAVSFEATKLRLCRQEICDAHRSRDFGEALGRALHSDDLAGVFVLSDGLNVSW